MVVNDGVEVVRAGKKDDQKGQEGKWWGGRTGVPYIKSQESEAKSESYAYHRLAAAVVGN
jgi:hypothetical protein